MRIYLHDNFINVYDLTNEELNKLKEMSALKLLTSVKITAETDAEKTELYNLLFNISVFFRCNYRLIPNKEDKYDNLYYK